MKGSGIEDLLIEVYAENTVNHVMSGKAVSRDLCSHFLTEAVLVTLLLEQVFDNNIIETKRLEGQLTDAFQNRIMQICQWQAGKIKSDFFSGVPYSQILVIVYLLSSCSEKIHHS